MEELKVIGERFEAYCMYVDSCLEAIRDNYGTVKTGHLAIKQSNDIQNKTSEMKKLLDEVKKIENSNINNKKILQECEALYIRMVSAIGYLYEEMAKLREEIKVAPLDIPEKTVKEFNMSWKEI
ncbi:MAG: hypothetical protein J6Y02_23755 [Pseudobutyrivibrio sp.]|nr:hypothetical protein [Pseudobutyrivibrio sp.]